MVGWAKAAGAVIMFGIGESDLAGGRAIKVTILDEKCLSFD